MTRMKSALTANERRRRSQRGRMADGSSTNSNQRRRAAAEGGSRKARERHVARGKLLARERVAGLIDPGSPFLEIGALAAFGMYEGDVHGAGLVAGIGLIHGREVDGHRQRPDDQGRRLLSDDGEEASARAGDRGREPSALRLSGRFGRREPASPGRSLPRPRAFRADLLQPGAHVRRPESPRSRWSWDPAPRAAPMCRRCRTRRSSSRSRARSFSPARRW